jgi:hypothetical protein
MRTLLRHAPTGLFLQAKDRWTGDRDEALDFKSMRRAILFSEQSGFTRMELAFLSNRAGWTTVAVDELRRSVSVSVR